MADVAKKAGVNRITVSRAISNPSLLSPKTLRDVQKSIRALGYLPDKLATGLRQRHSNIVTMIAPSRLAGVYGALVAEITKNLHAHGLFVNLFPLSDDDEQREQVIEELLGWKPAALLSFSTALSEASSELIKNAGVPVVELLSHSQMRFGTSVGYDHHAAAKYLTNHLLDRGHKNIHYVHAAARNNVLTPDRLAGFCEAITEAGGFLKLKGISPLQRRKSASPGGISGTEIVAAPSFISGVALMKELLPQVKDIDAILFASEMTAIGAVEFCRASDIDMPGELAVAAFDGTELSQVISPKITCLDFPFMRVAEQSTDVILDRISARSPVSEKISVSFNILKGETT